MLDFGAARDGVDPSELGVRIVVDSNGVPITEPEETEEAAAQAEAAPAAAAAAAGAGAAVAAT